MFKVFGFVVQTSCMCYFLYEVSSMKIIIEGINYKTHISKVVNTISTIRCDFGVIINLILLWKMLRISNTDSLYSNWIYHYNFYNWRSKVKRLVLLMTILQCVGSSISIIFDRLIVCIVVAMLLSLQILIYLARVLQYSYLVLSV